MPLRRQAPGASVLVPESQQSLGGNVGWNRILNSIRTRTRGELRAFLEKTVYNAPLGLLVTLADDVVVHDPRIIPISLSSLLWLR